VTAFLLVAGLVVVALVAIGLWCMERAGVEPGARATGEAPDATEEIEVRERWRAQKAESRSGILVDRPRTD
jgi:hypothetical protein